MNEEIINDVQKTIRGREEVFSFFSLPALEKIGMPVSQLPYSLRLILEGALRNYDKEKITLKHIETLLSWKPNDAQREEVPFIPSRIILQDYTGVPLLTDLVAMRDCVQSIGISPTIIEPHIQVDMVVDHSLHTYYTGQNTAIQKNMELEFSKNRERYSFMKWGGEAFKSFRVIPPGVGIVHQVNLEYLATGIIEKNGLYYPDTVVGTDSHTTMVNGLGVLGWGVGGIEAEAAMLGQPIYIVAPDVIGVRVEGQLSVGVTTTDIVLTLTELLRKENVVGKIVEYFGTGTKNFSVAERATIANMAPDYGATMGLFFVDEKTIEYYLQTGRDPALVKKIEDYYKVQDLFDIDAEKINYTKIINFDLDSVLPCVSGPRRPQDRITLTELKSSFHHTLQRSFAEGGYEKKNSVLSEGSVKNGDILIAGITSCTNTSNPSVLIAAGLLAKNAVKKGLKVNPRIKTSLAPGSRAVTQYLEKLGLQTYLDRLGFVTAGFGCATCVGNVGAIDAEAEAYVKQNDVIACAVLSGNRNFESRIHPSLKANFLMSPPLVVAFAIVGNIAVDFDTDPLGEDAAGQKIYLRHIWPTQEEINKALFEIYDPEGYKNIYRNVLDYNFGLWNNIATTEEKIYPWDDASSYIAKPPYFRDFSVEPKLVTDIQDARALAILGDSITTDHISPAGAISLDSEAGKYLASKDIPEKEFNTFGARRGHCEIMVRGIFSNPRLKNRILPDQEGGVTYDFLRNKPASIYDVAKYYQSCSVPTVIFAGKEYGTGSSRDWAAKGTALLGVRAVIAESFERIHRTNLVGMGVLPCQFLAEHDLNSLNLTGSESFDLLNIENAIESGEPLRLVINKDGTKINEIPLIARLDADIEKTYFKQNGILPYVLRNIIQHYQGI